MKKAFRSASPLLVPIGLFLLSFFCLYKLDTAAPGPSWLVKHSPYIFFCIAAVLSWRFNKTKVFFIVLVLALTHYILAKPSFISGKPGSDFLAINAAAAILFPVNILVFTFLKERGIFTVWGLINMSILLFQTGLVYYLLEKDTGKILSYVTRDFIPWKPEIFSGIPQLSVLLFLIVFILVILRYLSTKSYLDAANIGVLAVIFTVLCKKTETMSIPVFFTASGLILIISVIQESYSMAFMDELTGLPSRRSLRYELMKLSGRYTIAMLDIDHFKKFNDTYGHDVGDQVLKMVAGCIRDISGGGKPFRYGGEEFTVLFPNKGFKDATPHLEMLREAVSKRGFTQRSSTRPKNKPKSGKSKAGTGKQLFVTISIGVAEKNQKYRIPDEVIKGADNALYRAKKKGRNCVSR